jgi:RHS repeat-associated protein
MKHSILTYAGLLAIVLGAPAAHGLPSAVIGRPALIAPASAEAAYPTSLDTVSTFTLGAGAPPPNEVVELARALGNNVDEIYDFVRNYVDTVFIFGAQKGAVGAIVDKSGTPFDQAQLMVALLRQAAINSGTSNKYTATYRLGTITLTGAGFSAWTNVTDARAACDLLASGGIPASINGSSASMLCTSIATGTTVSSVTLEHIWVDVVILGDSNHYLFDPSYKPYNFTAPINLATAAGLTSGQAAAAAISAGAGYTTGASASGVNYVIGLNGAALTTTLNAYAGGLQSYIQNNNSVAGVPLVSGKIIDLVGGREISRYITPTGGLRQTTLPYTSIVTRTWTGNIPDQFRTLLTVNLTKFDETTLAYDTAVNNQNIFIDDVYGRRLTYDTNFVTKAPASFTGTLKVADEFGNATALQTFSNGDDPNYSIGTLTLTVKHPYVADAAGTTSTTGTYMNTVVQRTVRYSTPFTIVHGWGETNRGLIDKFGSRGNSALPLQPFNGCESCVTTYHASKGDGIREQLAASWLVQTSKAARLHASIANSIYTHHHSIGIVAGDSVVKSVNVGNVGSPAIWNWSVSDSFDRLDVETGFSVTSLTETATDRRVAIHAIAATSDALEGSVAAQNSDLPDTVSTATRFEWGNLPPPAEDPSGTSGSIGARRFYDFNASNASKAQALMLVEGKLTTTSPEEHGSTDPTIGPNETAVRQGAVGQLISSYATGPGSGTWDVVASEEAFLGPGQRGGSFTLDSGTHLYTHSITQQRGGAFVATRYDAVTGDPLEIAHIAANTWNDYSAVGIKGGGGGAQPNHESVYDPAMAADILKSQFVDRTKAIGVDLETGGVTYASPASLTVGSGSFPYSLSASLIWRGGQLQSQVFSPVSHIAPTTPWTTNWNNTLMISGSGIEAMGDSDIRATAGTVAAFMAMQDIYRSPVSTQREAAALLTVAWWAHQIAGNVATVNVGAESRHFLQKFDGTWFSPGAGAYAALTQTGARTAYAQPNCGGGAAYDPTRGWDYSNMSFAVTNTNGDQQNFAFWSTNYVSSTSAYCAFLHGFRMTNWTFPYGMTVNLVYQPPAADQLDDLVQVNNSLGRQINFVSSGLGGFNNGLTGADLRTVGTTGPIILTTTTVTHTEPTNAQTTINFSHFGNRWILNNVLRADNTTTPALAYTYDSLGRVKQAQDAVALQTGGRNPYQFYLGEGARADRVDPAGGDYTVFNDIYRRPLGYVDEIGRTTAVTHDGRGRTLSYTYPEGNTENFAYDDHNNTTGLTRNSKPGSSLSPISIFATWDQTWNKPTIITDAIGCTTNLAYYSANPGRSLLQTGTRCAPDPTQPTVKPVYSFTYTAIGRLLQATDPSSPALVTLNAYDPSTGNLLSTAVDPSGVNSVTGFTYDAVGNVATVTDPRTYVTENQYDAERRKTVVIHHNGLVTANAIAGEQTIYDVLGRVQEKDACIVLSGASCATWQMVQAFTFTPDSKIATEKDGAGDTTQYAYDPMDRTQIVTDPVGRRVASVYDLAGQTLFTWRGWNSTTAPTATTTWNPAGYTGTGPIRYGAYTYSPNGNQIAVQDANNNTTNLVYDGHDRLQFTLFTDPANALATCAAPTSDAGTPSCATGQTYEAYSYDGNGDRLSLQKRDGQVINFTYDLLSRLTIKAPPGPTSGNVYSVYDLAGRPTSVHFGAAYPSGTGVDYVFDSAKRVTSENTFGRSMGYQYDLSGNRVQVTWPDNNFVNHDFDGLNRDYQIRENGATSGVGVLAAYQYDPLSRRQMLTRGNGTVTHFGYDPASRLQTLAQNVAGTTQNLNVGFTYTLASQLQIRQSDNPLYDWTPTASNRTYTPDALNRYSTVAGTTFGYDGRGNLQSDGTRTFTYDVENRLLSEVGGAGLTLSYDPLGRLSQTTSGSAVTQFLYDGDRLVGEYSSTGTVLRRYVHGPGVDDPVVWYEGAALTDRRWIHSDERGSVIATTDGTGAATIYTYGPYGEPTSWTGSRFRYTGQIAFPEAQLYHYKARVYDPFLGRFLQTDPIGTKDDLDLYTYVGNDPLDKTDPTGETCTQNNGTYSCQVDSIKDAKGNVTQRADFSKAQVKQVAAFEKAYTKAVNNLASHSDRTTTVSVGDKSMKVSAGDIAKVLVNRTFVAAPDQDGKGRGAGTVGNVTTVGGAGLAGIGTVKGASPPGAEGLRELVAVHEGLHNPAENSLKQGRSDFNDIHQVPYNRAAETLLGEIPQQ